MVYPKMAAGQEPDCRYATVREWRHRHFPCNFYEHSSVARGFRESRPFVNVNMNRTGCDKYVKIVSIL